MTFLYWAVLADLASTLAVLALIEYEHRTRKTEDDPPRSKEERRR